MRLHAFLRFAAGLLCVAISAHGQGLSNADRTAVSTLEPSHAATRGSPRPGIVDLRDRLPPVGNQTMNDCAAWAFGYAARSYLEAVDQGWKPNTRERIFSPTFIYNQVNKGKDEGSAPKDVLKLLASRGAATMATSPYLAKDFTTPPPAGATTEAAIFPISTARLLKTGEDIRNALASGDIVVIGVRTNPVFNSGNYELYTAAMHQSARLARKPGQPHGYHAMVICGYSEPRRAFLFMNSWGTGWGQRGFVWVSYDVVDTFNSSENTENLMDFAIVMVDRQQLVRREGDRYVHVKLDDLVPRLKGRFNGLDPADKMPWYEFTATLTGPADLRDRVRAVRWHYTDRGQARSVDSNEKRNDFQVAAKTSDRAQSMAAEVEFTNGRKQKFPANLELPEGVLREIEIDRVFQYDPSTTDTGKRYWYICYEPLMSDRDWQDLKEIRWHINPGIRETYRHPGGLAPAFIGAPRGVYVSRVVTAPETGYVEFVFADDSLHRVELPSQPLTGGSPEAVLTYTARPFGKDAGRNWYYYEAEVSYPRQWAESIVGVTLNTGSAYSPETHQMQRVRRKGTERFVWSGFTASPIEISARLRFNRAGMSARSTTASLRIPFPAEAEAQYRANRDFGIAFTDAYEGERDGRPVWRYRLGLQMLNLSIIPRAVTWHLPGQPPLRLGEGEEPEIREDLRSRIVEFVGGADAGEVTAEIEFHPATGGLDSTPLTVRCTLQPSTPSNDALGLLVVDRVQDDLVADVLSGLVDVRLMGTEAARLGASRLECFYDTPWGTRDRLSSAAAGVFVPAERVHLRVPHPHPLRPLHALIHFDDGSVQAVSSVPRPNSPFIYAPRLQLEARERFAGYSTAGLPQWTGRLRVTGDHSLISNIERVEFAAHAIDGSSVPVIAGSTLREASLETSEPLRLAARVFFKDQATQAPMVIDTVLHTAAPRNPQYLHLALDRIWRAPHVWEKRHTIADAPSPELPHLLRVAGHARAIARIKAVEYQHRHLDTQRARTMKATRRSRDGVDGFPLRETPPLGTNEYQAKVTLEDGSTRTLSTRLVQEFEPTPSSPFQKRIRFWEQTGGANTYLATLSVVPDEAQPAIKVEYALKGNFKPQWPWQAASFARGSFPWDTLLSDADVRMERLTWHIPTFPGSPETEPMTREFDAEERLFTNFPAPVAAPRLEVIADPAGSAHTRFVRVVAGEALLAQIRRIEYEVTQAGITRVITPLDRFGETGDSFDCRLVGPAPTRISARLFGEDNKPLTTLEP